MNRYPHWSSCGLKHLLPALAQDWIANGHNKPIGSRRSFRALLVLDDPGQTQRAKHGDTGHKRIGGTAVIEEAEHGIALRSDGISNSAAMTAGSEDQPTV